MSTDQLLSQNDLIAYVWRQTDTTEFDLPAATVAIYLEEAFQRTIAAENRWPFYEQTWEVIVPAGSASGSLDIDVNVPAVMSVTHKIEGYKLEQIDQTEAELRFGSDLGTTPSGTYIWYSFWGDKINFWPKTAAPADTVYIVRGYRKPLVAFAPDGKIDADPRLHRPLAHYAIALAYAQQEDEVLERTYMERWQRDVEIVRRAIMDPTKNRPIVMHGNFPRTPIGGSKGAYAAWP